jgi:hypothetical protein
MRRLLPAILALTMAVPPAAADEFTDVIDGALEAYRDGDITVAMEELEYATKLLNELKAASLATFLPPAQAGWTRTDVADAEGAGAAMAMFGGGISAAATYTKGAEELTITLVANSPMVSGIGAMITGLAAVAGGKPMRIQRTEFTMNEGELQGVVDGKVLVSVSGSAPIEAKTAHLEAMDLAALGDF